MGRLCDIAEGVADIWRGAIAEATQTHGSFGIGLGALDARAGLAWACVGIPLAWGVYMTLLNVAKIVG